MGVSPMSSRTDSWMGIARRLSRDGTPISASPGRSRPGAGARAATPRRGWAPPPAVALVSAWGTRESVGEGLVPHGQPVLRGQLLALHARKRGVVDRQHAELGVEHFLVEFLVQVVQLPELGVLQIGRGHV